MKAIRALLGEERTSRGRTCRLEKPRCRVELRGEFGLQAAQSEPLEASEEAEGGESVCRQIDPAIDVEPKFMIHEERSSRY